MINKNWSDTDWEDYFNSQSWLDEVREETKAIEFDENGCDLGDTKPFWEFRDRKATLPADSLERKAIPIYSGVIKYFPDALAAVAKVSQRGNDQHNPNSPLHWDRSKSGDELDAMMRHVIDEDWDAVAWRALANLQKQLEK